MDLDTHIQQLRAGPRGPHIGAFFDFDGTLIDGYSALALFEHRLRNLEIGPLELFHTARLSLQGPLDEPAFQRLIEQGLSGWQGRPEEDILELGQQLFTQHIAGMLFHEAFRVVKAHQALGHTVVIATSATRMQVAPLAAELGITEVICTELESEQGLLTGRVAGRPPWAEGKLAAVQSVIDRLALDPDATWAYANGDEDIPVLSGVAHPVAVNPQPNLAATAKARRWPTLTLQEGPGRLNPEPTLRTAALYGGLIGACLTGMAVGALTGNARRGRDFATDAFAVISGPLGDVRVEVTGREHVWSHRPAVFLINHQSALIDLVVVTSVLRTGLTGVAKKEVKSVPVLGPLMTWLDFAYLDRADSAGARESLNAAVDRLEAGVSIVISPEGTRSLTPQVGPFRKGAFHLARAAGVPIVPIVIRNAGELMWRGAKTTRSGAVQVHVHPPIPTAGWTKADLDAAVDDVHALYRDTLADWPAMTAEGVLT